VAPIDGYALDRYAVPVSASSTEQVPGIFISYRREDTAGHAGRLYDRLAGHFGERRVFMDIDSIDPGADFVDAIEQSLSGCGAMIAVIGPHWLSVTDDVGDRRLDNPEDFVKHFSRLPGAMPSS
jgi:hypothetical protein